MSTYIIAEAGINHGGRLDRALRLIAVAAESGADAVKFQCFDPTRLGGFDFEKRVLLKCLALTRDELKICYAEACYKRIEFMATAFDDEWLTWLLQEKMLRRIKVASGQILDSAPNRALWGVAARSGLPVIISNGLVSQSGVDLALEWLRLEGCTDLTVLSCVSKYPTPDEDVSLAGIAEMRARYTNVRVGMSSHCRSFWPCVAAAYAGAEVIECHLTLDCHSAGPDHTSSLEPAAFSAMVREIRRV